MCCPYNMLPIQCVAHTMCCPYNVLPIQCVAHTMCCQYNVLPIQCVTHTMCCPYDLSGDTEIIKQLRAFANNGIFLLADLSCSCTLNHQLVCDVKNIKHKYLINADYSQVGIVFLRLIWPCLKHYVVSIPSYLSCLRMLQYLYINKNRTSD